MVTKLDEKVTILCTVDGRLDYQPLFGKGASTLFQPKQKLSKSCFFLNNPFNMATLIIQSGGVGAY